MNEGKGKIMFGFSYVIIICGEFGGRKCGCWLLVDIVETNDKRKYLYDRLLVFCEKELFEFPVESAEAVFSAAVVVTLIAPEVTAPSTARLLP